MELGVRLSECVLESDDKRVAMVTRGGGDTKRRDDVPQNYVVVHCQQMVVFFCIYLNIN